MGKYTPKVSIVIPAYNASNYLSQAIDSALAQSYQNIEIIVVNDGSTDDGKTEQVALRYTDKIKYFAKENGGSSSALNVGIQNMSGEWFSWLSHDDLYYPNKIQEEIDFLNDLIHKGVSERQLYKHILFGAADLIDGDGNLIRKESKKNLDRTDKKINCSRGTLNLIAIPTQDGFHGCSCLIHKAAFEEVGMFDETLRLLNDVDLWFRFYTNEYVVHFIPKVLVCGRVHAKQVSRSVGFSYHNPEQDMFWDRNLRWLMENYPQDYELFYLFGKTAFLKTRTCEGKKAFSFAGEIDGKKQLLLKLLSLFFRIYAALKDVLKKAYLKLFA